jgi:hypothetical protein
MAIAVLLEFDGSKEQYDQVVQKMNLGGKSDPGNLFHVAGKSPNGKWRVVDVWKSQAEFDKFSSEKIMPITKSVGIPPPTLMETWEVHNTLTPQGPVHK